jgi:protein gp37
MGENTKIEWCDFTFNPWIGCAKVSPGCAHCYAAAQDQFRKWTPEGWGAGKPRKRTSEAYWKEPVKWNKAAEAAGTRPRGFCASLADWLDDEVPIEWLSDLLYLIIKCKHLDWLLLTKRPQLWRKRLQEVANHSDVGGMIAQHWLDGYAPPNVWIGTTVEDQVRADERIPLLLAIPARVRFLSCEPLLGAVDFSLLNHRADFAQRMGKSALEGIHWVICGGESGGGARPMHAEWARSLRDQCAAAGVPFLFKQWGEWVPLHELWEPMPKKPVIHAWPDNAASVRMGKLRAGRSLGGRVHDGFPRA